ncbi:MAG: ATP-binding cassette domain-containing protein, partial [Gemmatimonadaceae bacterium]|nr:ATP-binding cassette domain-containing protein [Acetobacteraceae bacterium]
MDVAVRDLVVRYGAGAAVLDGVTLSIEPGAIVALVGANGAGKSTLLRALLRLTEPSQGTIALLGTDVRALRPRALRRLRARVGLVFQRHNLVPRVSVLGNVVHGA